MISIVVDIAFHNPKTYPIISAILSKLISFLDSDEDKNIARKGGGVAKKAWVEIEKQSGQAVVNSNSAKKLLKGFSND